MRDKCDCWQAKAFVRSRDEANFWREQHIRLAVRVAELEAEAKLRDFRDRTDVAWLQAKVVAQSRELKRLNDARNAMRVTAGQESVPDQAVESLTRVEVGSAQDEAALAAGSGVPVDDKEQQR